MVATSGVILFFLWLSNIPLWREPDKDMYHVTPLYVEPKKKILNFAHNNFNFTNMINTNQNMKLKDAYSLEEKSWPT